MEVQSISSNTDENITFDSYTNNGRIRRLTPSEKAYQSKDFRSNSKIFGETNAVYFRDFITQLNQSHD